LRAGTGHETHPRRDRPTDDTHGSAGPIGSLSLPCPTDQQGADDVRNVIPLRRDLRPERRPVTGPQTYTPAQVAELLGISLSGVYNHLRSGAIPSRRVGARWLVPRRQFHAWLSGQDQGDDL